MFCIVGPFRLLGVKADAVPGRLNQIYLYIRKYGYYYGQCSELCGVNHGFMPILLKRFLFPSLGNGRKLYATSSHGVR
jgi:hypothetical protein